MKKCIHCGASKPPDDFYAHSRMADGRLNKCKACCKHQARIRYSRKIQDETWIDAERERNRNKYRRLGYGGRYPMPPERKRASSLSQHMECPDGCERHHWSYREGDERSVFILTRSDHATLHTRLTYDADEMVFCDEDGSLLDTREKHAQYIRIALTTLVPF